MGDRERELYLADVWNCVGRLSGVITQTKGKPLKREKCSINSYNVIRHLKRKI